MSKFVEGDVVKRTGATLDEKMLKGNLYKVDMRTGPSSIKLCNGMSYHEDGFEEATVKERLYYEDANLQKQYEEREQTQSIERPILTIREFAFDKLSMDETAGIVDAMAQQVGGDHYRKLGVQPLELVLANMGYEAFRGACYTKINKYLIRDKDEEVGQLKKAAHVLQMWIEEAEKQANV